MNSRAQIALEHFTADFDAFLRACDDFETSGRWNVEKYGYMAAYFESNLFGLAMQTMSANGVFESAEAEVLNAMFATSYTPRQLNEMYVSLKRTLDRTLDANVVHAVRRLGRLDPTMRAHYHRLVLGVCEVIALADGVAEGEERLLIERVRIALEG